MTISSHHNGDFRQTVGIVIPTYNRVTYLREAVESALGQSHSDIELIVMDDNSNDGTAEYMATVADPRVRYHVNGSNVGLARNIDIGIGLLSEGINWCTVLCDDDYFDADFIVEALRTVERSGAKAIVHSRIVFVDEEGRMLRTSKPAPAEESASEYVKARAEFDRERYLTGVLFSRQLFGDAGGYPKFRTGMAADDGLVVAMALRDRLVYSDRGKVFVRIHESAESQALESLRKHLLSLQDYRAYCASLAEACGTMDAKECGLLAKRAEWHASEMSGRIWLESLRKLLRKGSGAASGEAKTLFTLGLDRELLFPLRVKMSSFLGVQLGVCPETVGLYRNIWRQVAKVTKRIKHAAC
jgi:glycosyltransferase involved in cell wall biosynthesis